MRPRKSVGSGIAAVWLLLSANAPAAEDCEGIARNAAERAVSIPPSSLLDIGLGDPALDPDWDRFEAEREREAEYRRVLELCRKRAMEEERLEAEIP